MAFDGIVTKSIVSELNTSILNGKINKIFEPNKNEIILGIYSNGKNYALDMVISSNNYRLNLTTNSKPNPLNAPNFCMLLRKHLIGGKIKKIYSDGLERIVYIEFNCYNELNDLTTKKLIIELMGKHSNIILTNENNIIIDSLRHLDSTSNSYRDILPAHEYTTLESDKFDFCTLKTFNDFLEISKNLESLEQDLPNKFNGISKNFIRCIKNYLKLDDLVNSSNLEKIYNYISELLFNISTHNCRAVLFEKDYSIMSDKNISDNLQINFFIDDFYTQKDENDTFKEYRNNLLKLTSSSLKRISKKLININSKLLECENMPKYQLYGELIISNLYKLNTSNLESTITLENYYDNNAPINIPIDTKYSLSINAKNYFKKYNKLKNTYAIANAQKKETINEIDYIESIIYEIENAKNVDELNYIYSEITENQVFDKIKKYGNTIIKNKPSEKNTKKLIHIENPHKLIIDGFNVFIGKNNKQNDYLTLKFANKNDIWFHTKDIHGSHVILQPNGNVIPNEVLIKCAEIAAYYSKAKLSSSVPVDYTLVKYVKKPSGAKPGMVIYTQNKTLIVNPKKEL